ncbi:MAG: DUF1598 domain-containing protein [Planctomycetaceae bacterium]|nr:DUF1598 domain-containing protein [Planctomycetales bacterium]MCB9924990.1 DUF1598 domain-containing protein [Planctomycetaceae bacterium]
MFSMSSRRAICALAAVVLILCSGLFGLACNAQDVNVSDAVRSHLDAGEFGLAADVATTANTLQQRDELTRLIVAAQVASGMFRASLGSASSIESESERAAAFNDLMQSPLGGTASRGGAALADFDTLITLIESTVSPDSWDTVGGPGAVEPFPTGVFVDASGLVKRVSIDAAMKGSLAATREKAKSRSEPTDIRSPSALRKVSLTKLECELQSTWASGHKPDASVMNLAGLRRISHVFVYPESRDIVIAGPAGDWTSDVEGRSISTADGSPILQIEDFVIALRNAYRDGGRFGCAITPTRDNLASVQGYLAESAKISLKPHQRDRWLKGLRERLGRQDISVFGIDPRTRTAQVLVEADYRMKLVGMGLEPGTLGVTSYLDSIEVTDGGSPPPMSVLRWWFTLNYDSVLATESADAFTIAGPGAKVLSENELLTERGERIHTGESDALNSQFAQSFTKHFEALARKYTIYAELRNVFDVALVAAILKSQDLPSQIGWEMAHLLDDSRFRIRLGAVPKTVETVMNHRIINRKHIVVGVSGGVSVDTGSLLKQQPIRRDTYGQLQGDRLASTPPNTSVWWWD